MNLTIGERVSWRGLNREYTGVVESCTGAEWLVRIDGSSKQIIISNNPKRTGDLVKAQGIRE